MYSVGIISNGKSEAKRLSIDEIIYLFSGEQKNRSIILK